MSDEFDNILEAAKNNNLVCGINQIVKHPDKIGKAAVYLAADARHETERLLKSVGITPLRLEKTKEEVTKVLELGFLSEVFCINASGKDLKTKKRN